MPLNRQDLIDLLRVKQWVKNIFVLAPLVFAGRLLEPSALLPTTLTIIAFCCLSSAVYIFNDIYDLNEDRAHPQKSDRPLASGRCKTSRARALALFFLSLGLLVATSVNLQVVLLGAAYLALNYIYNILTKKLIFIDVLTIAVGFQIRIWAGALAIGISPSIWLQACTLVLTLFLGLTKRRHELSLIGEPAADQRKVLAHYTIKTLDKGILVCCGLAALFYGVYTFHIYTPPHVSYRPLTLSTIFVLFCILRYLYLIHIKNLGDDPGDILLKDKPMMIGVLLWMGFVFCILYGHCLWP